MNIVNISIEEVEDILEDGSYVDSYEGDIHRWYRDQWYVIERNGKFFEFRYMSPLTELQEDQEVWESDPVPLYQVRHAIIFQKVWKRIIFEKPNEAE